MLLERLELAMLDELDITLATLELDGMLEDERTELLEATLADDLDELGVELVVPPPKSTSTH